MEPAPPGERAEASAERGRTDRYGAVDGARGGTAPHAVVSSRAPVDPREIWQRLRWYTHPGVPLPPAEVPWARFYYGLAQPLLGMRTILRDRGMLGNALAPVIVVLIVCMIVAAGIVEEIDQDERLEFLAGFDLPTWLAFLVVFFATFASFAPVPPMFFARQYARLAARARTRLGYAPHQPYLKRLRQSIAETIVQTLVIAFGIFPFTVVIAIVPVFGAVCAFVLQLLWTTHWMVVEAFDSGRTLAPGDDVDAAVARERSLRSVPWFVRIAKELTGTPWRQLLTPVRMVNEITETLVRDWGPELRIVERERALAAGFGVGVLILLAIPGINLLFRPALVVAATNLRAQLEQA
jgi:hypothetical protein